MTTRLRVGIACDPAIRSLYFGERDLERLGRIADVVFDDYHIPALIGEVPRQDEAAERRLRRFAADLDVLLLCHGAPRLGGDTIAESHRLKLVGELEGDRFGSRVDLGAAARAGVLVVDTTHSSSWPVAEWALALILLGLRQHARFRDIIDGREMSHAGYRTEPPARELTGRTVGLVGFGHIGWRLREFLTPFRVGVIVHDPFAPRELAGALDVDFVPLDAVMSCGITVCLAPLTPGTRGMIDAQRLALLPDDAVFVNVSRGAVVDTAALIERASAADAWFAIDAHDPEPIAVDSPLRGMRNVFLSPHIAGVTVEAQPRFFALMVDELERFARGGEPRAQLTDRVIAGRSSATR